MLSSTHDADVQTR
ncbi:uncharacterized, partial [Tachysurus ichikawai]